MEKNTTVDEAVNKFLFSFGIIAGSLSLNSVRKVILEKGVSEDQLEALSKAVIPIFEALLKDI